MLGSPDDRDQILAFTGADPVSPLDDAFRSRIAEQVEVLDGSSPATPGGTQSITVRLFSPKPENAGQIAVARGGRSHRARG